MDYCPMNWGNYKRKRDILASQECLFLCLYTKYIEDSK